MAEPRAKIRERAEWIKEHHGDRNPAPARMLVHVDDMLALLDQYDHLRSIAGRGLNDLAVERDAAIRELSESDWEYAIARSREPLEALYFPGDLSACERFIERPPTGFCYSRKAGETYLILRRRRASEWETVDQRMFEMVAS